MAEEIIYLGAAPAEESCVQVGSDDYARNAKAECRVFIQAIRAVCGPEPEGARLVIVAQEHDMGTYYEVVLKYDGDNRTAAEYAAMVDEKSPTTWAEARIDAPGRHGNERG